MCAGPASETTTPDAPRNTTPAGRQHWHSAKARASFQEFPSLTWLSNPVIWGLGLVEDGLGLGLWREREREREIEIYIYIRIIRIYIYIYDYDATSPSPPPRSL